MTNLTRSPQLPDRSGQARTVRQIAQEIKRKWENPYFGAEPYIKAMHGLEKVTDRYGQDDGKSIVLYFLSNAKTWRGEDARRIKAELKALVK